MAYLYSSIISVTLPFWTKKTMVWARPSRGYIACQALICGSWVSLNEPIRSSDAGGAKSDATFTANLRSARRARKPRRAPFGLKPAGKIARADPRWLTQPGAAAERILSIAVNLPPEKEACA